MLAAAIAADKARAAGSTAPLLGVPLGVKDSYQTTDLPTSLGLRSLKGFTPTTDAEAVAAIKDAGAIVFGKNNLVEMSYGVTGHNDEYGQVLNPYDHDRISGGSSSGSAASVAARIVPASFGGDTVGSIRIPAALNGVVGYKPTTSRWPRGGVAPISHTLDTTGLLARHVEDALLIDQIITGQPDREPPARPGLSGTRFAYAPKHYLQLVDSEVEQRFREILGRLREAGAEVAEIDLGDDFTELADRTAWNLFLRDTHQAVSGFLRENNYPVAFDDVYLALKPQLHDVWSAVVLPGSPGYLSDEDHAVTLGTHRPELQRRLAAIFDRDGFDALIFPTTPAPAPSIADQWQFTVAGQTVEHLFLAKNTVPASGAGIPGVSPGRAHKERPAHRPGTRRPAKPRPRAADPGTAYRARPRLPARSRLTAPYTWDLSTSNSAPDMDGPKSASTGGFRHRTSGVGDRCQAHRLDLDVGARRTGRLTSE